LSDILEILRVSQAVYFYPLREHVIPSLPKTGRSDLTKFQEAYHAMVSLSLSNSSFAAHLGRFLKRQGSVILNLEAPENPQDENGMQIDQESLVVKTRNDTLELMRHVDQVGLGGAQAQRIFAEVMSGLLTAHVQTTYAEKWSSPSDIPNELSEWVENVFARFVVEVLSCLRRENGNQASGTSPVTFIDLANWKHRAVCDLGGLRVKELFDIIVDWDNDSKGAIDDLKQYLTTTAARSHLTDSFSAVISHRLLHPGASTMEILKVYVSIIRVFSVLDPKGVLLDRLARPIRRYLRERDDKARIIVEGLLADTSDEAEESDALIELAAELDKATENTNGEDDDDELDYDDMNWLPDPVDAGPGKIIWYVKSLC
jgi:anaphase-promoting complex subunit 2